MSAGSPKKIILCAAEPSGDALGAALARALSDKDTEIELAGCGGPQMAAAGVEILSPIDALSVIGPISAVKAYPAAIQIANKLAVAACERSVDAAIFIDSWAFSKLAAERFRRQSPGTKLYKFVAPQVWGSRPKRAEVLAALFDGILLLFEFETNWFAPLGVKTEFVGHPIFQAAAAHRADRSAFRARHGIGDFPLLAVLPGSRMSEVKRHMPLFRETADLLLAAKSNLRFVIVLAPAVADAVRASAKDWPRPPVLVDAEERHDAFASADAALAASGTVTTELAIAGTPMAVAYQVDWASAMWVRAVATTEYVSLLNIAEGRAVVPEFLQEHCRPETMAAALVNASR